MDKNAISIPGIKAYAQSKMQAERLPTYFENNKIYRVIQYYKLTIEELHSLADLWNFERLKYGMAIQINGKQTAILNLPDNKTLTITCSFNYMICEDLITFTVPLQSLMETDGNNELLETVKPLERTVSNSPYASNMSLDYSLSNFKWIRLVTTIKSVGYQNKYPELYVYELVLND